MANLENPRDRIGKGGSGKFDPRDKWYQRARVKSMAVREGQVKFTSDEIQRVVAEMMLER